ncbi:hypothetical protein WS67_07155 [Burkholderia singularis]|uniref:Osmotically-inducible lipoprotein OsmE n=1 Tax=Burkholderia singularis TaxID=1503053 RepID=A0A103E572_9BURK|nr:hypothetical protein [Burkholderia singularis]KVE28518.1 hypothetical protein WS67_07155 [Burkholderia singularis]SMF98757.1 FIG00453914: hypothetical protein [Burkholderia singularis]
MAFQTTIRTASAQALACPLAAALVVSGCSWFGGAETFSYAKLPVPRAAAQPGATQTQIVKAGGNPASVRMMRNGAGVCYNYDLYHGYEHRSYYVVFDRRGAVARHGFATCAEADRKALLHDSGNGGRPATHT